MTPKQTDTINSMLARDISEAEIAKSIGMSSAALRSYLHRHPELRRDIKRCRCCGKIVPQTPHKREKQFCSDTCRMSYWNAQRPTKKPRKDDGINPVSP
ncbi:MAG: hypothetical protein LUD51_01120 [Clostridia bacterium]|nr:hypothetical protein [Clostridia bacterium]